MKKIIIIIIITIAILFWIFAPLLIVLLPEFETSVKGIVLNSKDVGDILGLYFGAIPTVASATIMAITAYLMLEGNKNSAKSVERMKEQNSMQMICAFEKDYKEVTSSYNGNGDPILIINVLDRLSFFVLKGYINEELAKNSFRYKLLNRVSERLDCLTILEYKNLKDLSYKWVEEFKIDESGPNGNLRKAVKIIKDYKEANK